MMRWAGVDGYIPQQYRAGTGSRAHGDADAWRAVNSRDCHDARGSASLPLDHAMGVAMAVSLKRSALPKWERTQYGADPRPDDVSSTCSPEQLARMDSDFCTRGEIALRAGGVSAATATYDLLAQRRVR